MNWPPVNFVNKLKSKVKPGELEAAEQAQIEPAAPQQEAEPLFVDHRVSLDSLMTGFQQTPLEHQVFVNSVPKCGTLFLRNILLMFVPIDQVHWKFVTDVDLSPLSSNPDMRFFTGHLNCRVPTIIEMKKFRHILIIRDPYDYVLSYARFFYTKQLEATSSMGRAIRDYDLQFGEVVRFIITGWRFEGDDLPGVQDVFLRNAMFWEDTGAMIVKYEDVKRHMEQVDSAEAETYWRTVLDHLGLPFHDNWRDRIRAGSMKEISSTAMESIGERAAKHSRRHLLPEEIKLFKRVAPDIRRQLGYE